MTFAFARFSAFGIALLAIVDPAVTSTRTSRPIVSVVASSPNDAVVADRVARQLRRQFTVVRGGVGAAAGTVLVGDVLPDEAGRWKAPVVAVVPGMRGIRIVAVSAPSVAHRDSRLPVDVRVALSGAAGRRVEVQLRAGDVAVDRREIDVPTDTSLMQLTLHYVPAAAGPVELRVTAAVVGTDLVAEATALADVTEERHRVLFFDARPSWMSTFVRRAVEHDPRFSVTSRVQASRGVSLSAGSPPMSLRDVLGLAAFTTVVVGAPESLSPVEVAGLDAFLRRRGGRVLLLMDRRAPGAIDGLTTVREWRSRRLSALTTIVARSIGVSLRGRDVAWPAVVPAGALLYATSSGRDSVSAPVVWSVPVGAGRLMVSGALDAWQYRDPATSGFDAFWSNTIADLSTGAPRPLDVSIARTVLRPGQPTTVRVGVLHAALASASGPRSASVSAILVSDAESTAVRLWPEATPGRFAGTIVAPRRPGTYRIAVASGIDRTDVPLTVDSLAMDTSPAESEIVGAFIASRGGQAIPEADLDALGGRVSAAFLPVPRVETWHPMRSPWWIIPFAVLLGAEWWWRRRRGLA